MSTTRIDKHTIDFHVTKLRPHPENESIFLGVDENEDLVAALVKSMRANGLEDPLVVKADGTILSGHLRYEAAKRLKWDHLPCRVAHFEDYLSELRFVIRQNVERRQLTKSEIASAYKRLRETSTAEGGTKKRRGPKTREEKSSASISGAKPGNKEGRDEAAALLGVGTDEARALEKVFTTPGVPSELKAAVNNGSIKPTPAAEAVRAEVKRGGGEVKDAAPLKAWTEQKLAPKAPAAPAAGEHERRVREGAEAFRKAIAELLDVYKRLDGILSRAPLKSVTGYTEHHEYGSLVRDVALRAWREVESIHGSNETSKQMRLVAIEGGKQ